MTRSIGRRGRRIRSRDGVGILEPRERPFEFLVFGTGLVNQVEVGDVREASDHVLELQCGRIFERT